MHKRQVIEIPGVGHKAPIPMGVRIGNLLCSSALIGMDPTTGQVPEDSAREAELLFANLRTLLLQVGASPDDLIDVQVLVTEKRFREYVNYEWLKMFPTPSDRPARIVVVSPDWPRAMMLKITAVLDG